MDEKLLFVANYLRGEQTMSYLCADAGISRKTGYKWLRRYQEAGPEGLQDQSRAPHSHPHALDPATAHIILAMKRKHPSWGPRKLLAKLSNTYADLELPAASTAGDLLRRYGLTTRRRRNKRVVPYARPFIDAVQANDVWCTDFRLHP